MTTPKDASGLRELIALAAYRQRWGGSPVDGDEEDMVAFSHNENEAEAILAAFRAAGLAVVPVGENEISRDFARAMALELGVSLVPRIRAAIRNATPYAVKES